MRLLQRNNLWLLQPVPERAKAEEQALYLQKEQRTWHYLYITRARYSWWYWIYQHTWTTEQEGISNTLNMVLNVDKHEKKRTKGSQMQLLQRNSLWLLQPVPERAKAEEEQLSLLHLRWHHNNWRHTPLLLRKMHKEVSNELNKRIFHNHLIEEWAWEIALIDLDVIYYYVWLLALYLV